MPRWIRTFCRLALSISAPSGLAVVGLVVFRAVVPSAELHESSGELGNYLQTLGGIYAVLLAFVVVVVWNQFNEARVLIEREASALVDLHRTASGLPAATRIEIQEGLRGYVDAVLQDEWQAMHRGDEAAIERVGHRLDEVWLAVHRCRPSDDCQHTIYGEVLSHFNELADLRTSRLTAARARVPTAMRILLYTGAVILVGSIYFVYIPPLWLHASVTAALAGAIAHILYIIIDLDDAFEGDSQISKAAFERARTSFVRLSRLVEQAALSEAAAPAVAAVPDPSVTASA